MLDQGFYRVNAATSYIQLPDRKIPMQLNSNLNYDYRVELTLPKGYTIDEHPGDLNLDEDFGAFSGSHRIDNRQLIYTKKFVLPLQKIYPPQYEGFKEFCTAIDEFERKDIIIRPAEPPDSAAD